MSIILHGARRKDTAQTIYDVAIRTSWTDVCKQCGCVIEMIQLLGSGGFPVLLVPSECMGGVSSMRLVRWNPTRRLA